MASVTVFVDDAVRGTLPGVCAKDGIPTSSGLTIRTELGDRAGLGVAWLLLLAGPIGWIGLLLVMMSRDGRREVLTVQIPLAEPAHRRLLTARRRQRLWVALAVVSSVAGLMMLVLPVGSSESTLLDRATWLLVVGLLVTSVVGLIANDRLLGRARVVVDLDASRRWVTLSDVHPAFVQACQVQVQRQAQRA